MISNFKAKFEESVISVAPVMAIVILLHFTIAELGEGQILQFVFGGAMLIIGLSIFLVGAELGMVPFGQRVGSALTHKRNLTLILLASFAIGFAITVAEPDVQVLVTQVARIAPSIDRATLLIMIALGVGIFLLIGVGRVVLNLPLRILLIVFYLMVFIACAFVEPTFIGVAFDSGGATTGPITVPFIMAMGIGVASAARKTEDSDSSFGFVGLASIGPIAAVAAMGLLSSGSMSGGGEETAAAEAGLGVFVKVLPHVAYEIFMALLPLLLLFFVFQFALLRMSAKTIRKMLFGFFYAYVGLVIFMVGVNGGFSPIGQSLGFALGQVMSGWVLIPVGLILGAVVVCAEPAVWILTEQVEEVSGGYIPRSIMLAALSLSIAVAVALGMLRVITGLSIWWILVPGYALSLILTFYCPKLFTAIAFDSGGVASGPMSTTFVLSLTLGAALALGRNPATDAFGMIAMIAMAPLITIQLLGMIFSYKEKHKKKPANKERAA